ncbi:hypothetical protein CPC08DRAFT_750156 [Agrocybe pediades]|nr:hypothetical protein CPC08DRAFT_750156 [Agrocybe pediades]
MLLDFLKAQVTRITTVVKSIYDVFYCNRLDVQLSISPLTFLVNKHGRMTAALFCAVVECFVCIGLLASCGIHAAIASTTPVMAARVYIIVLALWDYLLRHSTRLATNSLAYLDRTLLAQVVLLHLNPALFSIRLAHLIFVFFFGDNYIKYLGRHGKMKIYNPCHRQLRSWMSTYPFFWFVCAVVFDAIALLIFTTSVMIAFVFVYALDATAGQEDRHWAGIKDTEGGGASNLNKSYIPGDEISKALVRVAEVSEFSHTGIVLEYEVEKPKVKIFSGLVLFSDEDAFADGGVTHDKALDSPVLACSIVPLVEAVGSPRVKFPGTQKAKIRFTPLADDFVPNLKGLEASIHAPSSSSSTQKAKVRLTPTTDNFVHTLKGLEASIHAPSSRSPVSTPPTPPFVQPSPPTPPLIVKSNARPPVTQNRSMSSSYWAPAAPTVPIVIEAPKRRGGSGSKGTKDAEMVKPNGGLSRRQRHMLLMGASKARAQVSV